MARFKDKWQAKRCVRFVALVQMLHTWYNLDEDNHSNKQFLEVQEAACLEGIHKLVPDGWQGVQPDPETLIEWFIENNL